MTLPDRLTRRLFTSIRTTLASQQPVDEFIILLSTGSFNPVHRAHVRMATWAQQQLEALYPRRRVVAAVLSPSHDRYVQGKLGALACSIHDRLEMLELALDEDDFITQQGPDYATVDLWEAQQPGFVDFPEVTAALQHRVDVAMMQLNLSAHPSQPRPRVRVFYLCGEDHALKCGMFYSGLRDAHCQRHSWVAVKRPGNQGSYRHQDLSSVLGVLIEGQEAEVKDGGDPVSISSSRIREAAQQQDVGSLRLLTYNDVVAYMQRHGLFGLQLVRPATWFSDIFGVHEPTAADAQEDSAFLQGRSMFCVRQVLDAGGVHDAMLECTQTQRTFHLGRFDTPQVQELVFAALFATQPADCKFPAAHLDGGLTFNTIIADVAELHQNAENNGAVFQVASQFNCLEMPGPKVTPNQGVTGYIDDKTQGPVCAMACPAALIYRHYLINGGRGQGGDSGSGQNQIDLLADVGALVQNDVHHYWHMMNGYALPHRDNYGGIAALSQRLQADPGCSLGVSASLRVGVHWSTQVLGQPSQRVAQVFCSALPVTYSDVTSPREWREFAYAVLYGAMLATLAVGAKLARDRQERVKVFLTGLGGGAFGNPTRWIADSLERALLIFKDAPLDVSFVSYRVKTPVEYRQLVPRINVATKEQLQPEQLQWLNHEQEAWAMQLQGLIVQDAAANAAHHQHHQHQYQHQHLQHQQHQKHQKQLPHQQRKHQHQLQQDSDCGLNDPMHVAVIDSNQNQHQHAEHQANICSHSPTQHQPDDGEYDDDTELSYSNARASSSSSSSSRHDEIAPFFNSVDQWREKSSKAASPVSSSFSSSFSSSSASSLFSDLPDSDQMRIASPSPAARKKKASKKTTQSSPASPAVQTPPPSSEQTEVLGRTRSQTKRLTQLNLQQ